MINKELVARRLAIIVTLRCTLKCKLCCNCLPFYEDVPPIIPKEEIFRDMEKAFLVFDRIEWLQFVGGELFMHPDMDKILLESFKYDRQFDKIILMTNGTLVPNNDVMEVLEAHKEKFEVQISDYGELSYKIRELEAELGKRGIPYQTKSFHGDIQHYGGWIDCGGFEDRGETADKIAYKFEHCWQVGLKNYHMYRGKIHSCIRSLFGRDLNKVDMPKDEYIDVYDEELSLEDMKRIAANFNSKPLYSCKFCGGFDSAEGKRFPAAEQV